MLHIVNKSPFECSALESCLRVAQPGAAVLLIEDGIYAATAGTAVAERVRRPAEGVRLFALAPDIEARGMQGRIVEGVELVDYAGFVDLVTSHSAVQSWL
ncbi:DsrH protein [Burkholderiales bacterium]|nr:DsrH protein [Burkholderiales bacterium]